VADAYDLRRAARGIFDEALRSVNAYTAVRGAVELDGTRLNIVSTSFDLENPARRRSGIFAIAIGKAAPSMASALEHILGERITAGLLVGPSHKLSHSSTLKPSIIDSSLRTRWRVFEGGHPLPNRASLLAAQAAFALLQRAEAERALLIFLISGGGSALVEWPRDERITLRDLRAANRVLISCGATIAEINAVRRAFSAVKGGGLAACAPHADQLSLIISDTGAGEESTVASGPTFDPPTDAPDVKSVVERYKLASRLPAAILRAINQTTTAKAPASQRDSAARRAIREHYVLLDNGRAVAAAAQEARRRGFVVETALDVVEQPVAEGCAQMLSRLHELHRRHSSAQDGRRVACLVSGGEFACPVRGRGVGGRNSETALRCAIEMDGRASREAGDYSRPMNIVALSAGTDGIDGNSPAAGAIIDRETLPRARALGLDAQSFLDASDAYTFFDALGDAIVIGPTGTNVRDLRLLLAQ
jgi:hydroxypyruvate reductase